MLFFRSTLSQGPHADPKSPSFGLLGSGREFRAVYYGDDNARGGVQRDRNRGHAQVGPLGRADPPHHPGQFPHDRPQGLSAGADRGADLQNSGWRHYYNLDYVDYCPHMQAWLWCTYLWLYDKTRYEPLLERARSGLTMMMKAYPNWRLEANRVEQERCRMLLAAGVAGSRRRYARTSSMARHDRPLRHRPAGRQRGDPADSRHDRGLERRLRDGRMCTDAPGRRPGDRRALYASISHSSACTRRPPPRANARYAQSAAKMADFFIRTQTKSESHPELDGTWYRGFDFKKWDYWASDGDAGWGVWTNEIGWTHSWITATLALRHMKTSLWN